MTDIGIEAAAKVIFVEGWGTPEFRRNLVVAVLQAYLPFHPPASREEGLREAADIASDFAEAASSNADRLGQPSVWESAARTTARDIASAILALIPTKPEAKETREVGEVYSTTNGPAVHVGFDVDAKLSALQSMSKLDRTLELLKARATQFGSDEPEESETMKGSELLYLHETITSLREAERERDDLLSGKTAVIPHSKEHAEHLYTVAVACLKTYGVDVEKDA